MDVFPQIDTPRTKNISCPFNSQQIPLVPKISTRNVGQTKTHIRGLEPTRPNPLVNCQNTITKQRLKGRERDPLHFKASICSTRITGSLALRASERWGPKLKGIQMKNAHFNFARLLFCLPKEKVSPFDAKTKKKKKRRESFTLFSFLSNFTSSKTTLEQK